MKNRILVTVAAMGVATLGWAFWWMPAGEGEYRDSPDGRWRAHVSGLSRGTWLGSRRRYVELSIERLADGSTVWRRQIPHGSADTVAAYGDRSRRFISWSSDSLHFTVATTNGGTLTVPVSVAQSPEEDRAANRSRPFRSETNRTPVAARSVP